MKTSPELLTDILGVLGQINSKMGKDSSSKSGLGEKESKAMGGMGLNLNEFAQDKQKAENLKETAAAIKELSSALGPLSTGLLKFGLVPPPLKRSIINFMRDMLDMAFTKGVAATKSAKEIAEAMDILGTALPKLARGVFRFGIMQKLGFVLATRMGIMSLMSSLAAAGNPATLPFVLAGAAALASLGVALIGIASVLGSIAKLVLAFAGAIVIMVGAIFLATKLFNTTPLGAMLIIAGSVAILSGAFALLGLLGPAIASGGVAVAAMGKGLMFLGGGLLAFVGSLAIVNAITGSQEATNAAIIGAVLSTLILSVLFAGIGLLGRQIEKGALATQEMGKGMVFLAGGLLVLGGSLALLNMLGINVGEMLKAVAVGLAILGIVFAGLGLFSILIIPGTIALVAISFSLALFALVALGIGAVIHKLGGKEGLLTMSENISLLVGGVLKGVIRGVSGALLDGADEKGFFGKIGILVKNVGILIGSIFLLFGVSYALIMFAFAIKAFTQAGVIRTIVGYQENGEPIFGDSVNVVSAGQNIAASIGSFFTTLTNTFKNKNIIPDKEEIEKMIDILMGNQGYRVFGLRWAGRKRPGLLDALIKFADLISYFSKLNQLPVYEIDNNGRVKVSDTIHPRKVASNIVSTLSSFFNEFKRNQSTFESLSVDTTNKIAEILFGKEAFRLLGLRVGRGKVGILEPLLKFSDILTQYSKFGSDGRLPIAFDENGRVTEWSPPIRTIAANMVKGISDFLTSFNAAFTDDKIREVDTGSRKLDTALGKFTSVIAKFDKLAKSVESIDKLSTSIGSLATNIGMLVTNMGDLNSENLDKLTRSVANYQVSTSGIAARPAMQDVRPQPAVASVVKLDEASAELIATKLAAKISSFRVGTYDFNFYDGNTGGKLEIKP